MREIILTQGKITQAENERLIRRESFATSGRSIICPIRKKRT
jgi:hypothetical protein